MPCKPRTNRLSSTGLDQSDAARSDCGCPKRKSKSDTLGARVAKTPVVPFAHSIGIVAGSVRKEFQSGKGTALPTQLMVCVELGKPVEFTAGVISCDAPMFWKTPAPACITARGGRADPGPYD